MHHQITGETVGEVRAVGNMHQRKAEMASHSDCFIALPGETPPRPPPFPTHVFYVNFIFWYVNFKFSQSFTIKKMTSHERQEAMEQ